jgi:hypothetical protein
MSNDIENSNLDQTITLVSSEAQKLLTEAFKNLKSAASVKEAVEPPRLFFPNGIELIYIKLEAGLSEKTKVAVELKIAGEKGIKGPASESEQADESKSSTDQTEIV